MVIWNRNKGENNNDIQRIKKSIWDEPKTICRVFQHPTQKH